MVHAGVSPHKRFQGVHQDEEPSAEHPPAPLTAPSHLLFDRDHLHSVPAAVRGQSANVTANTTKTLGSV